MSFRLITTDTSPAETAPSFSPLPGIDVFQTCTKRLWEEFTYLRFSPLAGIDVCQTWTDTTHSPPFDYKFQAPYED